MIFSNISYYLYWPIYKIAKYFLKKVCDGVSTRHSFYFKKVVFLLSDIDLTLYVKGILTTEISAKIKLKFLLLRKIFPILGECNVYDQWSIDHLKKLSNPIEIARDPFLISRITSESLPSIEQKLIFILRLFKSDQENMQFRLNRRFKKLSYCFSLLQPKNELVPEDVSSLDFLTRYLKQNIIPEQGWSLIDFLILKILKIEQEDSLFERLWNIESLDSRELGEMSGFEKELFFQNICWEFWGMYSQIVFVNDYRKATYYLLNQQANLLAIGKDRSDIAVFKLAIDEVIEQFQTFIK